MSVNSSSFISFLHLPSQFLSNCLDSRAGSFIFTAFTGTSILFLLPLCIFVLYLGHQRRRQQGSASASPCDFITYHIIVMEMISVLGSISYSIGFYLGLLTMMLVAMHVFFITMCGQMFFYNFICIECYLAVVHPVTCLQLKKGRGIKIRNIIIWCVWLLCCAMMSIVALNTIDIILVVCFVQQAFSFVVVSFCSLSVLRVLKRGGPGEGSGDRERIDQSKQRAFYTIMAVMGTLLFRFGGSLVCTAVYASPQISNSNQCVVIFSGFWFCLPSSLASSVLFLHRAGKLQCCKNKNESRH